jgi:hypothetical protein
MLKVSMKYIYIYIGVIGALFCEVVSAFCNSLAKDKNNQIFEKEERLFKELLLLEE